MNRRDFSKTAGLVAATAVVAPKILAEEACNTGKIVRLSHDADGKVKSEEVDEPIFIDNSDEWDKTTPEQRAAIQRMQDNMPSFEIFKKVASDIPRQVPATFKDAFVKEGLLRNPFNHGDYRMFGRIGKHSEREFESGLVGVDLSDISYTGIWRQAVRNKHTSEPKLFIATIPFEVAKEVHPGQTILFEKRIPIGTSDVEIERMARESFLKLQELVVEYHNRES